jgi:hypothetical protein
MRPIPRYDGLQVPEPPDNGLAFLGQNVKKVLHMKPFCTLQKISIFYRRGLQK